MPRIWIRDARRGGKPRQVNERLARALVKMGRYALVEDETPKRRQRKQGTSRGAGTYRRRDLTADEPTGTVSTEISSGSPVTESDPPAE